MLILKEYTNGSPTTQGIFYGVFTKIQTGLQSQWQIYIAQNAVVGVGVHVRYYIKLKNKTESRVVDILTDKIEDYAPGFMTLYEGKSSE